MQDFYFTRRSQLEVACARLAAMQAPQLPLYRAAADGRIGIISICAAGADWPWAMVDRAKLPTVVVIGADAGSGDDPGPDAWKAAEGLRHWCAAAIVHGAGGEPDHYRIAAEAAETYRRLAFIECTSPEVRSWAEFLCCPQTLLILPRDGVHPNVPPREAVS